MKQTTVDIIRNGLAELLAEFEHNPPSMEGHWVRSRRADGAWQGSVLERPSIASLFLTHRQLVERLTKSIGDVLVADYPDHVRRVGIANTTGVLQPHMVLFGLTTEAFKRFGSWSLNDDQINSLAVEAGAFFTKTHVSLRLLSPAINVAGSARMPISFPGGVVLRPITDEEATEIYGGSPWAFAPLQSLHWPNFVFSKEIRVALVVGGSFDDAPARSLWEEHVPTLNRCIMALCTFKHSGPVMFDGIYVKAIDLLFGVGAGSFYGFMDRILPGAYEIGPDEVGPLSEYATRFEYIHSSLEYASQRLVDASLRANPRDAIVDAVIGLESILLNDVGEKNRGENRFRFSLNYASLCPPSERRSGFLIARNLYDLRSKIVHGGQPDSALLPNAAADARKALQKTLHGFSASLEKPGFLEQNFWLNRILPMLPDAASPFHPK